MKTFKQLGVVAILVAIPACTPAEDDRAPRITVSKDTTRITEPLTEDGYVDYAKALRRLRSEGVTQDNNLVVAIWRAMGPEEINDNEVARRAYFERLGIEPLPREGEYYKDLKSVAGLKSDEEWKLFWEARTAMLRPWGEMELTRIANWITVNRAVFRNLSDGLATRDKFYSPLLPNDEQSSEVQMALVVSMRELSKIWPTRAMLQLQRGDQTGAWENVIASFRFVRIGSAAPSDTEVLVRHALNRIAADAAMKFAHHASISRQQLKQYLADIESLPPLPTIEESWNTAERYNHLANVIRVAYGGKRALHDILGEEGLSKVSATVRLIERLPASEIEWDEALRIGNRFYDRAVAVAAEKTFASRRDAARALIEDFERDFKQATDQPVTPSNATKNSAGKQIGVVMCMLTGPAMYHELVWEERSRTETDLAILSLALAAYRTEQGKYPDSLAELAPTYVKQIPQDGYSGDRPIYKRDSRGYLLYSVGANLKDDGGAGPRTDGKHPEEDDIVVRPPKIMDEQE